MSTNALTGGLVVDGQPITRVEMPGTIDELGRAVGPDDSAVLIAGNGSRQSFGNRGGPFDYAISMRKLNSVLHYEPDDLTVAVEPGITVEELNSVLAERNQMLPFDDPQPDRSTVGGTFATGLGGPRRLGYGSIKDWVLGVEIMAPDGVITKSGGMVVKNVTGYDLPRLHFGAHGAFGIVTRLNLKVFPQPEAVRSIVATFERARDAHLAGQAVLSSQLAPASILVSNGEGWQLSICCEGASASIQRQTDDVLQVVSHVTQPKDVQTTQDRTAAMWPFCSVAKLDASSAVARLATPPSGQVDVLEQYQSIISTSICADLGSGLVYLNGMPSIVWREAISKSSQRAVFLALPPELKKGVDVFGGMDAPNSMLVTGLKDAFDPARRLNRGRFVLGL
ncbi:FAD-binding oxidoreductase [soil metagenome]